MKKHHRNQIRRCAHCGQRFVVNPRVGKRHRYCSLPACVKASGVHARKKWLKKNGGRKYFDRSDNTDRVRSWRKQHPLYWRRKTRVRRRRRNDYVITKALAAALRYVGLQDMIDTHLALKIGLISQATGAALQDAIAKEIRRDVAHQN